MKCKNLGLYSLEELESKVYNCSADKNILIYVANNHTIGVKKYEIQREDFFKKLIGIIDPFNNNELLIMKNDQIIFEGYLEDSYFHEKSAIKKSKRNFLEKKEKEKKNLEEKLNKVSTELKELKKNE